MNRTEWYKQRRLCRLKHLVYQSYGDEAPTKVYEATLKFPPAIITSVQYRGNDTSGYDVRRGMALLPEVKKWEPKKLAMFKDTLRSLMRSNSNKARLTSCGCTPFDWYRGFR